MTTDIDKLEGRELDRAVAEAMGWHALGLYAWKDSGEFDVLEASRSGILYGHPPHDSVELWRVTEFHNSLDACAPLLDKMRRADALVNISPSGPDDDLWCIDFGDGDSVWARPLPTAICRAWLHWKGAQNEGARGED